MPGLGRPTDYAKREAILEAGRWVLEHRRAGPLSVEAVAARAGVAKATFYRHFSSADALYDALTHTDSID